MSAILSLILPIITIIKSTSTSENLHPFHPHNSSLIICDSEKANIFSSYFYSNFTKNSHDGIFSNDNPTLFSNIAITEEDVYKALINLNTSKAMGQMAFPQLFCPNVLQACLATYPRYWKELYITKLLIIISDQIHSVQFGFLQNRSAAQQLLFFLLNVLNNRNQLDVIYLRPLTQSVIHIFCQSFNIGSELQLWFQAYIVNRKQYVSIKNASSCLLPGVPQGSILGPHLLST